MRETVDTRAQELLRVGKVIDVCNHAQPECVGFLNDRTISDGGSGVTVLFLSSTQIFTKSTFFAASSRTA